MEDDISIPCSTRTAAQFLDISYHRLQRAAWERKLTPPKGPGGSFLWYRRDIEQASRLFRDRPLSDWEASRLLISRSRSAHTSRLGTSCDHALFGVMFKKESLTMHRIKWKIEGVSEFGSSITACRLLCVAVLVAAVVIAVKFGMKVAIYLF